MHTYLARQPIFDRRCAVFGYELLYRDAESANTAEFQDGDLATRRLLSDAITLFGLPSLTNSKPAFVNFTGSLILNDFVRLAKPDEVVVEILEDVKITRKLIKKIEQLKGAGYSFAMDDYAGDERYDALLPLADIVKVDFLLTDEREQERIAARLAQYRDCKLLAEKVETQEDFKRAKSLGYALFQGYFFEKPVTLKKKVPHLSYITFGQLMRELSRDDDEVNFLRCAQIVHADAVMTYQLMKRAQTLRYYRGNTIREVMQMLMALGADELRRWAMLTLARANNVTGTDELIRSAYLRACFSSRLALCSARPEEHGHAFMAGMFSLMPRILGMDAEEMAAEVEIPKELRRALLGEGENWYALLLRFLDAYEMRDGGIELPDLKLRIGSDQILELYCQSLAETDAVFGS